MRGIPSSSVGSVSGVRSRGSVGISLETNNCHVDIILDLSIYPETNSSSVKLRMLGRRISFPFGKPNFQRILGGSSQLVSG